MLVSINNWIAIILVFLFHNNGFPLVKGYALDKECSIDKDMPEGVNFVRANVTSDDSDNKPTRATIGLIGDVKNVLHGIVTDDVKHTIWRRETTGSVGYGIGTLGSLQDMGDAMYVNGIATIRSTDNKSDTYYKTVTGREFRAQCSLFITHGSTNSGEFSINFNDTEDNPTLKSSLFEMHEAVGGKPFCFYGLAQFTHLHAISLSRAPVYGELIFGENTPHYYSHPNFDLPNEFGVIMGCAADFTNIENPVVAQKLSKNLYINPLERSMEGTVITAHCHVLGLGECVDAVEEINDTMITGVYHVLASTTIKKAKIKVFVIEGEESMRELSDTIIK